MSRCRWIGAAAVAMFVGCGAGVDGPEARCAGIGPFQLTITRFVNQGGRVAFEGRYTIPSSGIEATLTDGIVLGAHYRRDLDVVSVREGGDAPSWTLRDAAGAIPIRASTLTLTGEQLEGLKLRVAFTVGEAGRQRYELELHPAAVDPGGAPRAHRYDIAWRDLEDPGATAARYCMKPGGAGPAAGGVDPDSSPGSTMFRTQRRYDARPRLASIIGAFLGS